MYPGVPTTSPAVVSCRPPLPGIASVSSATFAIPKSHTFTASIAPPSSPFLPEEHDVLGLEIAVEHAGVVRLREGGERLRQDVHDPIVRERPLLFERGEQIAPVEELHRDVEQPVRLLAVVEDADQVRVIEARDGLRLAVEAGAEGGVGRDLAVHHFDRDGALERCLARAVDGSHRAGADEALDHELSADRPPDEAIDFSAWVRCRCAQGPPVSRPE